MINNLYKNLCCEVLYIPILVYYTRTYLYLEKNHRVWNILKLSVAVVSSGCPPKYFIISQASLEMFLSCSRTSAALASVSSLVV